MQINIQTICSLLDNQSKIKKKEVIPLFYKLLQIISKLALSRIQTGTFCRAPGH